jgi:hypothetical protein
MAMTEKEILSFQENIRAAIEEIIDANIGPLRFDDMRWPGECIQCGRPNNGGYMGICDLCRTGEI